MAKPDKITPEVMAAGRARMLNHLKSYMSLSPELEALIELEFKEQAAQPSNWAEGAEGTIEVLHILECDDTCGYYDDNPEPPKETPQ